MKSLSIALSGKVSNLKEAILSFIYPSHCIHCNERVESFKWMCTLCSELLEFSSDLNSAKVRTLEPIGPALSFLKGTQSPIADKLAKTIAAFMVVQLEKLDLGSLDLICPCPKDPFNILLAKHLSDFLGVQVIEVLKPEGFFSSGYTFKGTPYLSDKKVLVVGVTLPEIEDFSILAETCVDRVFYLSFV